MSNGDSMVPAEYIALVSRLANNLGVQQKSADLKSLTLDELRQEAMRILDRFWYVYVGTITEEVGIANKPRVKNLAAAVVAIVPRELIVRQDGVWLRQAGETLAQANKPWCHKAKFGEFGTQPLVAKATGFVVGADLILTARHNFPLAEEVDRYKFVFDLELDASKRCRRRFADDQVFEGRVVSSGGGEKEDWTLIRLDRPVAARRQVLKLRDKDKIDDSAGVFSLGFPAELPMKFTGNAEVTENSDPQIFSVSIGGFNGSSGSPVFNLATEEVEGMLTNRGAQRDFVLQGCRKAAVVEAAWPGETAVRITGVVNEIRKYC